MSTYSRVSTPRAYMDRLSFNLANGFRTISNYTLTDDAGSPATVTPSTGVIEDLFDLRPSNYITIAAATQRFRINIDTGQSSNAVAETNFLAILGHNFDYADAVFKVEYSDSATFASGVTVASNGCTRLINAAVDADADYVDPANNGWTLITWADNSDANNQYKRITIEDDSGGTSNFDQDVQIGAIIMGEYISWPVNPRLEVGFDIDYDGTDIVTSAGGGTFANTSYLGSPTWAKTNPWALATAATENQDSAESRHYGRRKWNMDFSYIADTSLFSQNMHLSAGMIDGSDLYSQFYHKSLGSHLPFLFTIDEDSTDEGDYGLYRLTNGGLQSTQQAFRFWNTKLNLIEHW